jgi:hypothetical protein
MLRRMPATIPCSHNRASRQTGGRQDLTYGVPVPGGSSGMARLALAAGHPDDGKGTRAPADPDQECCVSHPIQDGLTRSSFPLLQQARRQIWGVKKIMGCPRRQCPPARTRRRREVRPPASGCLRLSPPEPRTDSEDIRPAPRFRRCSPSSRLRSPRKVHRQAGSVCARRCCMRYRSWKWPLRFVVMSCCFGAGQAARRLAFGGAGRDAGCPRRAGSPAQTPEAFREPGADAALTGSPAGLGVRSSSARSLAHWAVRGSHRGGRAGITADPYQAKRIPQGSGKPPYRCGNGCRRRTRGMVNAI